MMTIFFALAPLLTINHCIDAPGSHKSISAAIRNIPIPIRELGADEAPGTGHPSNLTAFSWVTLKDGLVKDEREQSHIESVRIQKYTMGDVLGDKKQEIALGVQVRSRGTMTWGFIYLLEVTADGRLCFRDLLQVGDRATYGLKDIRIRSRRLLVRLYTPQGRTGDCCTTTDEVRAWQWDGTRLISVGVVGND